MVKFVYNEALGYLSERFNKKKIVQKFGRPANTNFLEIQKMSQRQCLGKKHWVEPAKINSFMVSAETGTFMKWGGLGMIASELPEAFNNCFASKGEKITVVTPLYLGNTGKKKNTLEGDVYTGAEGNAVKVKYVKTLLVPFLNEKDALEKYKVKVYKSHIENTDYIFLDSFRFFSINPHDKNPSAQDGCYVMNEFGINEVERFAFFSKSVFVLLKVLFEKTCPEIAQPNSILANDWHSGAISGLTKYLTIALNDFDIISDILREKLCNIPIIHIAHHLGYQGWDYENSAHIINSLYEDMSGNVFKNAKAVKNSNPRVNNVLIVHDCYNQASTNFHLADRVVTVSKNYQEEVSKDLAFGLDFRDILKIRKDHRNFFGIVNGYDKKLISPNKDKIEKINSYFKDFNFKVFDEKTPELKQHNKAEFIKLISKIATDKTYRENVIPMIDAYKFQDIMKRIKNSNNVPIICATSRLVEQKGYDIAAQAILNIAKDKAYKEPPVFILGGAGDINYFDILKELKDKVAKIDKLAAERIFVFRGYKDEFAYAIQLASDFYLMPCRFEPCGLTQMEAMAKGALPIAMSTGGLVDTIDDGVNGFRTEVFFGEKRHVYGNNITARRLKTNENAYQETLQKALRVFYSGPSILNQMTYNAMHKDFSWDVPETGSVYKYYKLLKTGCI